MNQVFVDSSFFFALLIDTDKFHREAEALYEIFKRGQHELIVTNFILDETYTLLRAKKGLPKALQLRQTIESSDVLLSLVRVTKEDEDNVWEWFEKDWSKLSYTDCVSFAVMQRLDITHVATFDEHFSRAGFTIAS